MKRIYIWALNQSLYQIQADFFITFPCHNFYDCVSFFLQICT